MGPDGFVQGREYVFKNENSKLSGQLEIDKHWYRFMIFAIKNEKPSEENRLKAMPKAREEQPTL